jgi:hypothetical protein
MSYSPPAGNAVNFELALGGAYTPPGGSVVHFEMAWSGSFTTFITSVENITVGKPLVTHLGTNSLSSHANITLAYPAPHSEIYIVSILSAPPTITVAPVVPTEQEASHQTSTANITLAEPAPSWFRGYTSRLTSAANITLAEPTSKQRASTSLTAVKNITLAEPSVVGRETTRVSAAANITLTTHPVTQKYFVRNVEAGVYDLASITLTSFGAVSVSAPGPSTFILPRSITESDYSILTTNASAKISVASSYSLRLSAVYQAIYSFGGLVRNVVTGDYDIRTVNRVNNVVSMPYKVAFQVGYTIRYEIAAQASIRTVIGGVYSLTGLVRNMVSAPYNLMTHVNSVRAVPYNITPYNLVRSSRKAVYSLLTSTVQIVNL